LQIRRRPAFQFSLSTTAQLGYYKGTACTIGESPGEAALTGSKGKKILKVDCEAKDKIKKEKKEIVVLV